MKTVIYTDIGGRHVIRGFGACSIDAVETKRNVKTAMGGTAIAIEAEAAVECFKKARSHRFKVLKKAKESPDTTVDLGPVNKAVSDALEKLSKVQETFVKEADAMFLKKRAYHPPPRGEMVVKPRQIVKLAHLFSQLEDDQVLTIEGEVLSDFRGCTYWLKIDGKWEPRRINDLGEEPQAGCVLDSDLTLKDLAEMAEQKESARVASLSETDRQLELENSLNSAALACAAERSACEIRGGSSSEALTLAKEKYEAAECDLLKKYSDV